MNTWRFVLIYVSGAVTHPFVDLGDKRGIGGNCYGSQRTSNMESHFCWVHTRSTICNYLHIKLISHVQVVILRGHLEHPWSCRSFHWVVQEPSTWCCNTTCCSTGCIGRQDAGRMQRGEYRQVEEGTGTFVIPLFVCVWAWKGTLGYWGWQGSADDIQVEQIICCNYSPALLTT